MSDDAPHADAAPPSSPKGEIGKTYGHFRVLEPLGRGGMGVVYAATDTRLDRTVALKFLPTALNEDREARARFATEARAASALDHPNICTVHDIGESDDGRVYIAMAYYEGETLEEKIRRGPLRPDEALNYAGQVARGLAKAHAAGIVHRDIKPANVIVTEDGIAKILDFGLAKLEDVRHTRTGHVLGTIRYMSPEQSSGETVDHRTDLWSVGVLLYEMLTGRYPFGEGRVPAILHAILNEDPPALSRTNPNVPAGIERIVDGCLAKDPRRRYASAEALLADIERSGYASGPPGLAATSGRGRRALWPRRTGARAGLAVAALLALTLALPVTRRAIWGGGQPAGVGAGPVYVAVLPLTSASGDPDDQALADGLTYSLATMLVGLETQRDSFLVVPASEVVGQSVTTAAEARRLFGVTNVLRGRFVRGGDGAASVQLELIEPEPVVLVGVATLPSPDAPEFRTEVRAALAGLFGVESGRVDAALARNEPTRAGAYAYYLQGLGYLHRSDLADNTDNAMLLFERAILEDPAYALAHAGLCEARFEKFRQTADPSFSRQALESCDRAAALDEDQAAVLIAVGSVLLRTGEPDRALRRLREAERLEPDNADVYRWLGRYHEERGEEAEMERAYLKAIELRPDAWIYHSELAVFLAYAGRVREARERYREVTVLTPDNYLGYNGMGFTSLWLNEIDEARRYFQASLERRPNPIAYRNLGYLELREGEWTEAIAELEKGLAISDTDWWSWRHLAQAAYWSGQEDRAREAWGNVVDIVTPLLEVNPGDSDLLLGLAEAHVLLGNRDEGRRLLDRALLRDATWNYFPFYIGRLYEILGSRESAVEYVTAAVEGGFDPVAIDNDPWLAELRRDPRYAEARRRVQSS